MAKMGVGKRQPNDHILNREMGEGAESDMKPDGAEPGVQGYHRSAFDGMNDPNYRIEEGYKKKDESPARSEDSDILSIAHHSVTGELYSGEPEGHGHKNKAAWTMRGEPAEIMNKAGKNKGGGTNEEAD
jgi:hypothetical protein